MPERALEDDDDDGDDAAVQPAPAPAKLYAWQKPLVPEPAEAPSKVTRTRLSSQEDVARQLRVIFRQVASGKLSSIEGRRQAAILKSLAELMVQHEVERRLGAIERSLKASGRGGR
jgi:hypothetical protein